MVAASSGQKTTKGQPYCNVRLKQQNLGFALVVITDHSGYITKHYLPFHGILDRMAHQSFESILKGKLSEL